MTSANDLVRVYVAGEPYAPNAMDLCMSRFANHAHNELKEKDRYIGLLEKKCKEQRDEFARTQKTNKKQIEKLTGSIEEERRLNRKSILELQEAYKRKYSHQCDEYQRQMDELVESSNAEFEEAQSL